MQKRIIVGLLVVLASVATSFTGLSEILPPSKIVTLTWNYPQDPEIVFNVYQTTNLAVPMQRWTLVATVPQRSCVLPFESGSRFFTVTASNIVTRLESDIR